MGNYSHSNSSRTVFSTSETVSTYSASNPVFKSSATGWIAPIDWIRGIEQFFKKNDEYKRHFSKPHIAVAKCLSILSYIAEHHLAFYVAHRTSKGIRFEDYPGCPFNMELAGKIFDSKNQKNTYLLHDVLIHSLGYIEQVGTEVIGNKQFGISGKSRTYKLSVNIEDIDLAEFSKLYPKPEYKLPFEKIDKRRRKLQQEKLIAISIVKYKEILSRVSIRDESKVREYISIIKQVFRNTREYKEWIDSLGISNTKLPNTDILSLILGLFHNQEYETTDFMLAEKHGMFSYLEHSINTITNTSLHYCYRHGKGRVYIPTVSFKRELRALLQIDGKPTVEADIGNSQPLIAVILIEEWWRNKQPGKSLPKDVIEYRQACEQCVFYEYFMELFPDRAVNRGKFKGWFFGGVYFCMVDEPDNMTDIAIQFKKKYPSCYEAICDIKGGIGSEEYNKYAIKLQEVEAEIMFNVVTLHFVNQGIPVLNGFDSIICTPNTYSEVEVKIKEAFQDRGLTPIIKCDFNAPNKTVEELFNLLLLNEYYNYEESDDKSNLYSNYKLRFGKYKGKKLIDLTSKEEIDWCKWFVKRCKMTKTKRELKLNTRYKAINWWIRTYKRQE